MDKPIVLVVMDGIGISTDPLGNAVMAAHKPTLDKLFAECPNTLLKAHGTAVGLPSDEDMGNSEVGHNALGCGQIYEQGAKLVNLAIERGEIFRTPNWRDLIDGCKPAGTLHLTGLLSDGNVHSHIDHLKALIRQARDEGVSKVRVHILLDGRDVPSTSALDYVAELENLLLQLNTSRFDARIASGGGRMTITMDRYQADWEMVRRGWQTHVQGIGRGFTSATEAILTYRKELGVIDQDLPAFVITEDGLPVGPIVDGDSVIFFNFRGDRAIEISMAFEDDNFTHFDRGHRPKVVYAGMLQYDGDLLIPKRFLVNPPAIHDTLTEVLITAGIREYAVSETQKYGHVTYFWNGNYSGKRNEALEDYAEIASDSVPFSERPWMKAAEVTDALIAALRSGDYRFLRCNFANGDMVGHTGNYDAARIAVETVDLCLARILKVVGDTGAILIVTADHGNADQMLEKSKSGALQIKTAHTLNPVPFLICAPGLELSLKTHSANGSPFGLANVAATVLDLFGIEKPDTWQESLLQR